MIQMLVFTCAMCAMCCEVHDIALVPSAGMSGLFWNIFDPSGDMNAADLTWLYLPSDNIAWPVRGELSGEAFAASHPTALPSV